MLNLDRGPLLASSPVVLDGGACELSKKIVIAIETDHTRSETSRGCWPAHTAQSVITVSGFGGVENERAYFDGLAIQGRFAICGWCQSDLLTPNGQTSLTASQSGYIFKLLLVWMETAVAKEGFQLIDAEMHVMEPVDLWERYIDPEFTGRAPRRLDEHRWDIRTIVEGEVMAAMPGGDWPALTDAEEKALAERYAEEIARNFDPESQVRAMDKEGLDLAILFPTSAMYFTASPRGLRPQRAAHTMIAYTTIFRPPTPNGCSGPLPFRLMMLIPPSPRRAGRCPSSG